MIKTHKNYIDFDSKSSISTVTDVTNSIKCFENSSSCNTTLLCEDLEVFTPENNDTYSASSSCSIQSNKNNKQKINPKSPLIISKYNNVIQKHPKIRCNRQECNNSRISNINYKNNFNSISSINSTSKCSCKSSTSKCSSKSSTSKCSCSTSKIDNTSASTRYNKHCSKYKNRCKVEVISFINPFFFPNK